MFTKELSNRFDLEQQILKCWNITDDLDLLYEKIMEDDVLDRDKLANIVLGLSSIANVRFEKCFSIFEEMIRSDARG